MSERAKLTAGDLALELVPEIGGSVASFQIRKLNRWIELMRPLSHEAQQRRDPTGTAMFPMVPYANRIAGNQFEFEGHRHRSFATMALIT